MGRPSASERGYNARWHSESRDYLASHPYCVMCAAHGRTTPATVVDHKIRHHGDQRLFWDRTNWQGLCASHHNAAKQAGEARGKHMGCDVGGWPLDGR